MKMEFVLVVKFMKKKIKLIEGRLIEINNLIKSYDNDKNYDCIIPVTVHKTLLYSLSCKTYFKIKLCLLVITNILIQIRN